MGNGGIIGDTHIKMLPPLFFFTVMTLFSSPSGLALLLLAFLFLLDYVLVLCMGGVSSFPPGLCQG